MYKCIIIDDEERSIGNLSKYIYDYPGLEIAATYTSSLQAFEEISQRESVDLIFMDVDMPVLTGIELAKMIRHKAKRLIFTTAHSKYAFEAYEVQAEAYLLKPFSFAKFAEEVNRVLSRELSHHEMGAENYPYMLVKLKEDNHRIVKVDFDRVVFFESYGNYLKLYVADSEEPLISYLTLKDVRALLESRRVGYFLQVHRAFIISEKHIEFIQGNMIIMTNGKHIQISGHFKDSVRTLVEKNLATTSRTIPK